MKVIWMPLAKEEVRSIAKYIREEYGVQVRNNFIQEVRNTNRQISRDPLIGKLEPLLDDFPFAYRSIVVNRLNKIVYRIIDNHIEVADFWDCRRDPNRLVAQVIELSAKQFTAESKKE